MSDETKLVGLWERTKAWAESNASHRPLAMYPMSASHPITTELVRHNEPTLRATSGCEQSQQGSPYSVTSSAWPSSEIGTVSPSMLADFMFMIISTLLDCCQGKAP